MLCVMYYEYFIAMNPIYIIHMMLMREVSGMNKVIVKQILEVIVMVEVEVVSPDGSDRDKHDLLLTKRH